MLADDESDFKDLLKECGSKRGELTMIKTGLKEVISEQERLKTAKPFVMVITGGDDLAVSEETALIEKAFAGDKGNRKALLLKENNVAAMTDSLNDSREVECVHFALHGAIGSSGEQTLAMKTSKDNSDWRTPDEVGDVIKISGANVKSIVLNVCKGANSAGGFIGGADHVIGWRTDVNDSAAVQFSEQYYKSIKNGDDVVFAYFHALENMKKVFDWQFDLDPSNKAHKSVLRERRVEKKRSSLKIAGVPALYAKSGENQLEEISECPENIREKVEIRRRSTYGAKLNEILNEVKFQGDRVIGSVEGSMHIVMNSMFELSEFTCPRTFVILPYKLTETQTGGEGEAKEVVLSAAAGSSMDKAGGWMTKLTSVINVVSSDVAKVRKDAAKKVEEMFAEFQSEKMYLYLVDEVTGDPVVGPGYPIVIKAASEKAKEMLPLMTVGLKTLRLTNKATGLARCFGLPAPSLMTAEMQGMAENFVSTIGEKSSVASYDVLQSAIDEDFGRGVKGADDGKKKKLRGAALSEFKRFLGEQDKLELYAGLVKTMGGDGHVTWTVPVPDEDDEAPTVRSIKVREGGGDVVGKDTSNMKSAFENQVESEDEMEDVGALRSRIKELKLEVGALKRKNEKLEGENEMHVKYVDSLRQADKVNSLNEVEKKRAATRRESKRLSAIHQKQFLEEEARGDATSFSGENPMAMARARGESLKR